MDLLTDLDRDARRLGSMPGHVEVVPTTDARLVRSVLRTCGHAHHVPPASRLVVASYVSTLDQRLVLGAATLTVLHRDQVAEVVRDVAGVDPDAAVLLAQQVGPLQQDRGRLAYTRHLAVLPEGAQRGTERLLGLGLTALARRLALPGLLLRRRVRADADSDHSLARTGLRLACQLAGTADPDPRCGDRCSTCPDLCCCPVQFHVADTAGR